MNASYKNDSYSVRRLFNRIHSKYDVINRILSLGLDTRWRVKSLTSLPIENNWNVMDACTGTGDTGLILCKYYGDLLNLIVGVDFSEEMLKSAYEKIRKERKERLFSLINADVLHPPFSSEQFDLITMTFGIRNIRDTRGAVRALVDGLKTGGWLVVIEFGKPENTIVHALWWIYITFWIPLVGLVFRRFSEYFYLVKSIKRFVSSESMCSILSENHLDIERICCFLFGSVRTYICRKRKSR